MSDSAKFPCLDEEVSQAAFALLVGISSQATTELAARGLLPRGQTAREWLRRYTKRLRTEAAGRGESSLAAARTRESNAKALKAEVETAKALGQLVPASEAAAALHRWSDMALEAIQSAEARSVESLTSRHGLALADEDLAGPLRAARVAIGQYARDLAVAVQRGELASDATD